VKAVRSKPSSASRGVREKVYLTYPPKLLKEPIIYQLGQKFRVVTNIRGANISAEVGLVALEVDGAQSEVSAALRWLSELGVRVEPIAKNVIE
jgi:ABC-type methionine transport system ATPase subunit